MCYSIIKLSVSGLSFIVRRLGDFGASSGKGWLQVYLGWILCSRICRVALVNTTTTTADESNYVGL